MEPPQTLIRLTPMASVRIPERPRAVRRQTQDPGAINVSIRPRNPSWFAAVARALLGEMSNRIDARLSQDLAEQQRHGGRIFFKGGVGLASYSASEANEIAEIMPLIGEYADDAELLAAEGLTLEQFVCSRLADEHGVGMCGVGGYQSVMSADLKSALAKQSAKFAERFGPASLVG